MALTEAREYIKKLHKLQDNPYKWPDYLTGLPDRAAVLKKINDICARPKKCAISFVKISNIHPYLTKYGSSRHAEIVQWAAAILKTTASHYKNAFVGTVGTHEFVVLSRLGDTNKLLGDVRKQFRKKMKGYYSKSDLEKKYLFSFQRDGEKVLVGFMDLIHTSLEDPSTLKKQEIIPSLAQSCAEMEEFDIKT